MANFDRANHDNERDYDGGPDDDENEGSHLPVVIIIAVIVLAAFGGVVWLAYNQGVARGRNDVPVHVATASKADDSGIKVYQQSAGPDEEKAAAPVPATPAPTTPAPEAAAPPPEPSQTIQTPPPAPVVSQPAPKPAVQATHPAVMPKPVTPPPPAPKSQPQVAAAKPYNLPASDEPARPQVATKPPAQLGGTHPAVPNVTAPAPAPTAVAKATPSKPVTPPPAGKPAAAPSGSYLLQIGAYKSDADAQAAWKAYQSKHATLLNGFGPDVQRTTHDDGSVWYRLRIASFSNKDAASALCDRLKAQGGACFLSK